MVSDLIPVLWLCGPPGIGKSTVGWEIFTQLTQAGIEAGYVDIDQLGMCYPEPAPDPGRHRMKAQNLGAAITLCRLHAGAGELTRRIMLRGHGGSWPQPGDPLAGQPTAYLLRVAAAAVAEAEALERAVTGALRVDTDGLTVEETADLIAARTRSARG